MAGVFSKHRFRVYNASQHIYRHTLNEFQYSSDALPGVDNVEEALNWVIDTIYPLSQSAVPTVADLPTNGVITFDGTGRVQGAHPQFKVGDQIYFTSTGTLPGNFLVNTIYKVSSVAGGLTLTNNDGSAVTYTGGGSGVHTLHSIDNAFRVVFDDGDGKAAGYRFEQRLGDVAPQWYKIYDMDWSQDQILAQFQNITQDLYVYQQGKDDTDALGVPLTGAEAGQHVYGGASNGTNLTLHANSADGVGAIRIANLLLPTVTDTLNLGSTLLKFNSLFLKTSALIDTMTIATGSITDTTGTISFDNENLTTTGDISGQDLVASQSVQVASDISISLGTITSASGQINFDNESLLTSGQVTAGQFFTTGGNLLTDNLAGDLFISSSTGDVDFDTANLKNITNILAQTIDVVTAYLGALTISGTTISSTGKITLSPDISNLLIELNGDVNISNDAIVQGALGVTGTTTLDNLFIEGDVSTAGTFINFLKDITVPTVNATNFKGTNLVDGANNSEPIADIVKFPFTATLQDQVPHWDTATSTYIPKVIDFPDHGELLGLADDDHTQYVALAGRTGGQEIAGAAAAAPGNLTLIGQAGAVNANEIIFKDKAVPFSDASYAAGWQGYDVGKASGNWRHIYSKGEHFGLRLENVSSLPTANVINIGRLVFNTTDNTVYVDIGGAWQAIAGGSSSGDKNLVSNGDLEAVSASIFVPYQDAAGTRPVDGTGGTPTVTTSLTTTNPLDGAKSALLTKPASNVQGQGWSTATQTLPLAYRAKSLKVSFDYIVNSGTFVAGGASTDGDVIVTFYDVTNAKIVEPSNIKLFTSSTTGSDKFEATVQFDSTCTQFRPIIHVASTSTADFELKVDNMKVSPSNYVYAPATTAWKQFTPEFTGIGTPTSVNAWWRRNGENLEVYGRATSGTVAASGFTIGWSQLGLTLNTSKIITDTVRGQIFGEFEREVADGASSFAIGAQSTFINYVFVADSSTQGGLRDSDANAIIGSGEKFSFKFSVPINGWEANLRVADSYDGRIVAARYSLTSQTVNDNTNTTVIWANKIFDTVGMIDTSTGVITARTSGLYRLVASIGTGSSINIASGNRIALYYKKNGGVLVKIGGITHEGTVFESVQVSGSDLVELNAGDTLEIVAYLDYAATSYNLLGTNDGVTYLSIEKLAGTQAITASEKVVCSYRQTSGQTFSANAIANVLYNERLADTHGAYNTSTGEFTAPSSGFYTVGASTTIATLNLSNQVHVIQALFNGVIVASGLTNTQTAGTQALLQQRVYTTAWLEAGQKIVINFANNGQSNTLSVDGKYNTLTIVKV